MDSKTLTGFDKVIFKMTLEILPKTYFFKNLKNAKKRISSDHLKILTWKRKQKWKQKRMQFLSIALASTSIQKHPSQRFRQLNTLEI